MTTEPTEPPSTGDAPIPATEGIPVTPPAPAPPSSADALTRIREQVRRVLYGQDALLDQVLAALVAGGHVLIEGKPGLGKTHLVLALAKTFGGHFGRIQFTPDLMPTDVTGHTLYDMSSQSFRVRKGPVFTNLLLADEINRAPAKTQAALLEVMQEEQVTIDGDTMKLDSPFMVLATQNPIEQDGTYPLPEAQLDRFLMKLLIEYPEADDEASIVQGAAQGVGGRGLDPQQVDTVSTPAEILQAQQDCARIECVSSVIHYAVSLVRATRDAGAIAIGAGTRGAISLVRVGKAYALLSGRAYVTPDDIKRAALPVLRHRITLAPESAIAGLTHEGVLEGILDSVTAPRQ